MTSKDLIKIKELLSTPQHIVITTHMNPDGDAMGSSLAMYNFLFSMGHKVQVIAPSSYPVFLHWLPGNDRVMVFLDEAEKARQLIRDANVLIFLDFNTPNRVGGMEDAIVSAKATKILIDHHMDPEPFSDYMLSDVQASSTAELVSDFIGLLELKDLISKEIAECIYTGILTDTGSFSYGSTTAKAHRIAGELIQYGADNLKIQGNIFQDNSLDRVRLLGFSLYKKLTVLEEYNTGYFALSKQDLMPFNFRAGDTEGLVNYAMSVKNIDLAVLMLERKSDYVKLSFRSNGTYRVDELAKMHFNGGGHKNAAGGEYHGSLPETVAHLNKVLNKLHQD